ncbi:MAG: hypothetical protein QXR30_04115 [Candidatus Woesearchaeota archaeon]
MMQDNENFKDLENIVRKYENNLPPLLNYQNNFENNSDISNIKNIMSEVKKDYDKLIKEFNLVLGDNSNLLKKVWYKVVPKNSKELSQELEKIHNLYLAKTNKLYIDVENEYRKIEKNLLLVEELIKEKQAEYYKVKDDLLVMKSFYDKFVKENGVTELNKFELKRIERGIFSAYNSLCSLEAQIKYLNSTYQQLHNTQILLNEESKFLNQISTFLQASLARVQTLNTEFDIKDFYDIIEKSSKLITGLNSTMGKYGNLKLKEERSLDNILRNVNNSNEVYEKQMKNFEDNMMINQKIGELGDLNKIIEEFEKKLENKEKS